MKCFSNVLRRNALLNSNNDSESQRWMLERRQALIGLPALGLMGSLNAIAAPSSGLEQPRKGGTLRMGLGGGSPSDSLDPRVIPPIDQRREK